jgi:uncharacterized membrane protein YoaK (UPF0700 family)
LVSALIGARIMGLLVGRAQLRRAGLEVSLDRSLLVSTLAAGATVGGAAAAAAGEASLTIVALLLLGALAAVSLRDAREPLRMLLSALRERRGIQLTH